MLTRKGCKPPTRTCTPPIREYLNALDWSTRAVKADTGTIGGDNSHEFHVLADSGEDEIAICRQCSFAANVEMIPAPKVEVQRPSPTATMQTVDTPNMHTIEELSKGLKIDASQTVKTLIVQGTDGLVALVVRGDHELNSIKAEKLAEVQAPFTFASTEEIGKSLRCDPGSIGPVGIDLPVIVDADAGVLVDFVCGANQNDKHLTGVNWGRIAQSPRSVICVRSSKATPVLNPMIRCAFAAG